MLPHFIQVNCHESNKIDLRQAKAVIKYKPNAILFEIPNDRLKTNDDVNKYKPTKKPLQKIRKFQSKLRKVSKTDQWVASDILVFENIISLWRKHHQILLYNVDAPSDLVFEWNQVWKNMYPSALRNWLWWVRIFLREQYMAKNIRQVLADPRLEPNPTILVFLQSFHWKHVKFLLSNPSKKEIWNYYFKVFPNIRRNNIASAINKENKIFSYHWKKISPFAIAGNNRAKKILEKVL